MSVIVPGNAAPSGAPLQYRTGRVVSEYHVQAVRGVEADERTIRQALDGTTVEAWRDAQRMAYTALLSPSFPAPVALNAQTTDTLARTGYTVENVIFDSDTGWRVTGNLYIPDAAQSTPAIPILVVCGHDSGGKYFYRALPQALAKLGYVAFIIDAIGMGERRMIPQSPVNEHNQIAWQLHLCGRTMAAMQVWDMKCALDYLLSRDEVDSTGHIGVCGHSGGATQTVLFCAYDDRVTMAAPSCYSTLHSRNVENDLVADGEQIIPGLLTEGVTAENIIGAFAPNAMLMIDQQKDYWDVRGLRALHEDVKANVWTHFGAEDDFRLYIGPQEHLLYQLPREKMYEFFKDITGGSHATTEPSIDAETQAALTVTASGSVNGEDGARTSQAYITDIADALAVSRGTPTGQTLIDRVLDTLKLPSISRDDPPDFRIWQTPTSLDAYPSPYACVYAIDTEPGILVSATMLASGQLPSEPPTVTAGTRCILYVAHASSDQELDVNTREPLITSLIAAEPGVQFVALDVRGIGESKPAINSVVPDAMLATYGELLERPMLGRRVWDVLRTIDLLASYGYTDIHLAGKGYGAIVAALAGLLDDRVTQVSLTKNLTSWHAIATAAPGAHNWPLSVLPFGVLAQFDMPDVEDALATKSLSSTNKQGAAYT